MAHNAYRPSFNYHFIHKSHFIFSDCWWINWVEKLYKHLCSVWRQQPLFDKLHSFRMQKIYLLCYALTKLHFRSIFHQNSTVFLPFGGRRRRTHWNTFHRDILSRKYGYFRLFDAWKCQRRLEISRCFQGHHFQANARGGDLGSVQNCTSNSTSIFACIRHRQIRNLQAGWSGEIAIMVYTWIWNQMSFSKLIRGRNQIKIIFRQCQVIGLIRPKDISVSRLLQVKQSCTIIYRSSIRKLKLNLGWRQGIGRIARQVRHIGDVTFNFHFWHVRPKRTQFYNIVKMKFSTSLLFMLGMPNSFLDKLTINAFRGQRR